MPVLTKRALEVLRQIAALPDGDEGAEIVRDGLKVWCGLEQLHRSTLDRLLNCTAVSRSWGEGAAYEVFTINDTGRAIARRPELADEVFATILKGKGAFTIKNDRVVAI